MVFVVQKNAGAEPGMSVSQGVNRLILPTAKTLVVSIVPQDADLSPSARQTASIGSGKTAIAVNFSDIIMGKYMITAEALSENSTVLFRQSAIVELSNPAEALTFHLLPVAGDTAFTEIAIGDQVDFQPIAGGSAKTWIIKRSALIAGTFYFQMTANPSLTIYVQDSKGTLLNTPSVGVFNLTLSDSANAYLTLYNSNVDPIVPYFTVRQTALETTPPVVPVPETTPPVVPVPETTPTTILSTFPVNSTPSVNTNISISAVFSEAMDPLTINATTFTVSVSGLPITGTVTYNSIDDAAIFAPAAAMSGSTHFNVTISTGVKDVAGNALSADYMWSFDTAAAAPLSPPAVILGTSANFAILAETTITNTPTSAITGDIGLSPAAETFLLGFNLTRDVSNTFSTSVQVTGTVYAADMLGTTPATLSTAIADMVIAYADAAGRTTPDYTELGAGSIGGMTLTPGLYRWSTAVTIPTNVTISGGANDIWIFQISGNLSVSGSVFVLLSGGAQAKNVFWQVAGQTTLGSLSDVSGNILCQTGIEMLFASTLKGRILAQTSATLDNATVIKPAP